MSRILFSIGKSFIKFKLLRYKIPLVVSWMLTSRCNQRCSYCKIWDVKFNELNTKQIFSIIDELVSMGTKIIIFTGGEPLLREDIGEIITYTTSRGIYVSLNSNGVLIKKRIKEIKGVNRIKLSIDGPRQIHDSLRGEGSFDKVMEAITICKANNIKIDIKVVLSKYNINCLDAILSLIEDLNLKADFQPATLKILWSDEINPVAPPEEEYKRAIQKLIMMKKAGTINIQNSISGLQHLYNWPHPKRIRCAAGILSCKILPNGYVISCDRNFSKYNLSEGDLLNSVYYNFREMFNQLKPSFCFSCWCSSVVEFNLAVSLNLNAVFNLLKSV